jgi:hypothetical protein
MTVGVTAQRGVNENAYLTLAEYKNAPTSIDSNNLVVGGNQEAQDAELNRVILRATSYLNEYLNQDLTADQYTETQRVRVNGMGYVALHPFQSPVISLSSFEYGSAPNGLVAIPDPSQCWFENQEIIIPLANMATSWSGQGPLAFGPNMGPNVTMFAKYTYVAGFVNTLCTGTAAASTIVVESAAGILPGEAYRIFDGAKTESVIVSDSYTYGSLTVPLAAPLIHSHAAVCFSGMPNAIKQATILATTAFIKMRGDSSMTMNLTTQPTANIANQSRYSGEIAMALDMVNKYRRVR